MVVIAVSGLPGAGSSTIARLLAKKLKLRYFSPGEYFKSYSKSNRQTYKAMDVWMSNIGRKKQFHNKIDKMQIDLAKKGDIVICGKLSVYILKDIADHKIWIECSLNERARRTSKRDKISFEEAKKNIKKREEMETREWKRDYGLDYKDQKNIADIVINTTNLNEEETLKKILVALINFDEVYSDGE